MSDLLADPLQWEELRLHILPFVPVQDTLALYFTCKAWQKTIARHNEIAVTAQDRDVRPIKAPPDAYLVTSLALVQWALGSGCWDRLLKLGTKIAFAGNLDVLKLYRERGGEWGADQREGCGLRIALGVIVITQRKANIALGFVPAQQQAGIWQCCSGLTTTAACGVR